MRRSLLTLAAVAALLLVSCDAGTPMAMPALPDDGSVQVMGRGNSPLGSGGDGILAALIGLTPDEFHAAINDGASLADIAIANDKDPDAILAAMIGMATNKIEMALADGTITAAQGEMMRSTLEARMTEKVYGDFFAAGNGGGMGRQGGKQGMGGMRAQDGTCQDDGACTPGGGMHGQGGMGGNGNRGGGRGRSA